MSWSWRPRNPIEGGTKRRRRNTAGIAAECPTDCLGIGAVLDGDREHDRGVTRVHVGGRVRLMVRQKQLADRAVGKLREGRGVRKSADLEGEGLTRSAVREMLAPGHVAGFVMRVAAISTNDRIRQVWSCSGKRPSFPPITAGCCLMQRAVSAVTAPPGTTNHCPLSVPCMRTRTEPSRIRARANCSDSVVLCLRIVMTLLPHTRKLRRARRAGLRHHFSTPSSGEIWGDRAGHLPR